MAVVHPHTSPDAAPVVHPDLGLSNVAIVEEIGRGGFSVVYRAHDTKLNRFVAVKLISGAVRQSELELFEQECQIHGPLSDHPNVVTIHDAGQTPDGRPFLVMEYLDGGSLADRLRTEGPIPWEEAIGIIAPICEAVELAHCKGVLHRDIKPANILLSKEGAKLADFGIACVSDATSPQFAVSWLHAPPEAQLNQRDERSDVYSLASTLYAMLHGRAPFERTDQDSIATLLHRMATEPIPNLSPDVAPPWLDQVLQRALANSPSGRPPRAAAFRDELLAGPNPSVALFAAAPFGGNRAQPTIVRPRAATIGATDGPVVSTNGPVGNTSTAFSLTQDLTPAGLSAGKRRAPARKRLAFAAAAVALAALAMLLSPALASIGQEDGGQTGSTTTRDATTTTEDGAATTVATAVEEQQPTTTEGEPDEAGDSTTSSDTSTTETTVSTTETTQRPTTTETTNPPVITNEVPNVVGLSESRAASTLRAEGFDRVRTTFEPSSRVAEGFVIRTDPASRSVVAVDAQITITVSTGSATITVPPVIGLELAEARAQLVSLGFDVVAVDVELSSLERDGLILDVEPGEGTEAAPGSTITLAVGAYVPPEPPPSTTSTTLVVTSTTAIGDFGVAP